MIIPTLHNLMSKASNCIRHENTEFPMKIFYAFSYKKLCLVSPLKYLSLMDINSEAKDLQLIKYWTTLGLHHKHISHGKGIPTTYLSWGYGRSCSDNTPSLLDSSVLSN